MPHCSMSSRQCLRSFGLLLIASILIQTADGMPTRQYVLASAQGHFSPPAHSSEPRFDRSDESLFQDRARANRQGLAPDNQVQVEFQSGSGGITVQTTSAGRLPEPEFVPGEVLVKFRSPSDARELVAEEKGSRKTLQLSSSEGLTDVLSRFDVSQASMPFAFTGAGGLRDVLKLSADTLKGDREKTRALVLQLRGRPEVEYAELNLVMRAQAPPNDTYYSSSSAWGQGFRDLWGLQKINVEPAWNHTVGSQVVVAVSDTGVDYNHEDIAGNIWQNQGEVGVDSLGRDKRTNGVDDDGNGLADDWHGYDFVTSDATPPDNDPMDDNGHGTHVAGTIAAVGNNGKGIIGVAYGAKVMPVKGLNAGGSGTTADLVKTILYAADNGAHVINASWGGFADEPTQTLIDAIAYAHDTKGVVFVAAAGNSASDVGTQERGFAPANIRNVITVAASDQTDTAAPFSNRGQKIDVTAPGGGDTDPTNTIFSPGNSILSLLASGTQDSETSFGALVVGGKYLRIAGTSMASPHVAGAAALIRSFHPEFTPEQVRQVLRLGSDDVGAPGFDIFSGAGRINVQAALTIAVPLVAQLTSPTTTVSDACSVGIRGTAAGGGFTNWRLEHGSGTNPTTWTQFASSTTQVTDGQLANWNTTGLADGAYTIRLIAQNSVGQLFEDRLVLNINNASITEPGLASGLYSAGFRSGVPITIKGTAAGCDFLSYSIRILRASDGQLLSNPDISLTGDGFQKVLNGVLGTWNTTNIPADYYQIILEVRQTNGSTVQKSTRVIVDPALHAGWPRNLGLITDAGPALAITDHLTVADINGDGAQDIVVGYGSEVRIFDHSGNMLPGWPRTVDPEHQNDVTQVSPAVGDLDGDGIPEIVAATGRAPKVFIWHADGTLLPGWPRNIGGMFDAVAIDDINGDHVNEVIATDWFGRVKAFDKSGQFLPGWPKDVAPGAILSPACIGDLDGDGQKEIVVQDTFHGDLYVLSSGGAIKPGWPKHVSASLRFIYPALGDLDGDGKREIVVPTPDGKVYAFNSDGSSVPGWPQTTNLTDVHSPAIGDLDGDGKPEVVVAAQGNGCFGCSAFLHAWRGNGTALPNWPVEINDTRFSSTVGAPALADIDGDGKADVIVGGNGGGFFDPLRGPSALTAYKSDGLKVTGYPKPTINFGAAPMNTVAVADIDGDGLLEMAWIDGNANLYVWDVPSLVSAPQPWPMFHHDARHTGLNPGLTATPSPTPTPIPSPSPTPGPAGLQYYPLAHPVRLLDTRPGAAACFTPGAPLTANASRTQAAVGTCDGLTIPATAKAIVGNATVVSPPASGHITLYPSDAALPTASNLNYVAGRIVPNAFTVGLSAAGAFNIYTPTQTHFIVDVAGYYAPPGQGGLYYHPLPRPVRLLDTRPGATACDAPGAPLAANASRTETARTTCNGVIIPNDAQAVVGNATVVTPPAGGFITLYPSGAQLPTVSNLNYTAGQIIPNAFTVTVGSDGAFNIFTPTQTHFIADITGYYSASAAPDSNGVAGLLFYPLSAPARLLDTRAGTTACFTPGAPLAANSVRTQAARGVCAGSTVPTSALAVLGNATVVSPAASGYIILYPSGATQPVVSNLNYLAGQIIPNAFNVTVGGDGAFNIYTPSQTHFIVDMSGYFAP